MSDREKHKTKPRHYGTCMMIDTVPAIDTSAGLLMTSRGESLVVITWKCGRLRQHLTRDRFSGVCLVHGDLPLSQNIIGAAQLISRPCRFVIGRQRANRFTAVADSLPAGFKRRVEPDCQAVVKRNQGAIRWNGPGSTAKRDHARVAIFQDCG